MKRLLLALYMLITLPGLAMDKLDNKYLVSYGDPESSVKVIKYYSFMCPYCLALYRQEFESIKAKYIENGSISYTFHPVPKDLLTVCAMDCLEKLSEAKKKAFLEVMLEEVDLENIEYSINLMKKAAEVLGSPIPNLSEKEYLQETRAFKDAFTFLSQDAEIVSAVPSAEINGKLLPKEVPDLEFLQKAIKAQSKGE
jgi:Thioredoxin